jgi:hypothetical protein
MGESQAKANLDDARILMSGVYNDRLSYKVRFRLNRSFAPTSQDNGSRALDMALIKYKFGKDLKWSVTAGKQSAMVGVMNLKITQFTNISSQTMSTAY